MALFQKAFNKNAPQGGKEGGKKARALPRISIKKPKGSPKNKYTIVITVDTTHGMMQFCSMLNGNRASMSHEEKAFRSKALDESFLTRFEEALREYLERNPNVVAAGIYDIVIVLPDSAIALDTLNLPTLGRRAMASSVTVTIDKLYKNRSDLKINRILVSQNKQQTTYGLTILRGPLFAGLTEICGKLKIGYPTVTFAANATVNAMSILQPKYRTASYLLMDVKNDMTRFAFVAKGRTTGYYALPFGISVLRPKPAAEDMLFDHSLAELIVLNAKEKAKAKQLTMMGDDNPDAVEAGERAEGEEAPAEDEVFPSEELAEEGFEEPSEQESAFAPQEDRPVKTLGKKTPRKLPKFMLRPAPESNEEQVYENFRLLMKWALCLVRGNEKITAQGFPECICVNLPPEYAYLLEKANEERAENGILFVSADIANESEFITNNLELFGGFFAGQFNRSNNF